MRFKDQRAQAPRQPTPPNHAWRDMAGRRMLAACLRGRALRAKPARPAFLLTAPIGGTSGMCTVNGMTFRLSSWAKRAALPRAA